MLTTSHFALVLPEYTDSADVATINSNTSKIDTEIYKSRTIHFTSGAFSYLPQTFSVPNCTANHILVNAVLSNLSAQLTNWTVTNTRRASENLWGDQRKHNNNIRP